MKTCYRVIFFCLLLMSIWFISGCATTPQNDDAAKDKVGHDLLQLWPQSR
jgi:hypothetical protein